MTHQHLLACVRTELHRMLPQAVVRLLDVGCGDGGLIAYLQSNLAALDPGVDVEVHGFDVSDSHSTPGGFPSQTTAAVRAAVPDVPWEDRISVVSTTERWPYPDGSFDLVVSNQVIEHVRDRGFFFSELQRTLKPGGVSIHAFPLRHELLEPHLYVPMVHRLENHDARVALIRLCSRLGIGTFGEYHRKEGIGLDAYAESRSDYVQFNTYYASWRDIGRAAKDARLRMSYRYTGELVLQKLASKLGRRGRYRYRRERSPALDALLFMLSRHLWSVTVVLEKPLTYGAWRAGEDS